MTHEIWWLGDGVQQPLLQSVLLQCPMAYISTYNFASFKQSLNDVFKDLLKIAATERSLWKGTWLSRALNN